MFPTPAAKSWIHHSSPTIDRISLNRKHSSRMHAGRLLSVSCSIEEGGCVCPEGVCLPFGRGCLPSGVVCPIACWDTPLSCEQNNTGVKTLPCPKLHLRVVNIGFILLDPDSDLDCNGHIAIYRTFYHPQTKFGARQYFHKSLSFYPQG